MSELTHCRSCGEPIYMLRHDRTGKTAPIEAKVSDKGNCFICQDETRTYRVIPQSKRYDFPELHLNHYVMCPQSPGWHQYAKGGRSA